MGVCKYMKRGTELYKKNINFDGFEAVIHMTISVRTW